MWGIDGVLFGGCLVVVAAGGLFGGLGCVGLFDESFCSVSEGCLVALPFVYFGLVVRLLYF